MREAVRVGFLGAGTVGMGALALLERNAADIAQKVGCPIEVVRVADLDWSRPRALEIPEAKRTTEAAQVLDDPSIDIVVEVIGGVQPALSYVLRALGNGKNVVTSNKELIAKHGKEILDEAGKHQLDVCFEGAVGGGIPIIRPLKQCLAGNRIQRLMGIVNGTTNYILTEMSRSHRDFPEVLAEAQAKGYAEANPADDVEGTDAAYKLTILASIAFTSRVDLAQVYREGIGRVGAADMAYAQELGYVIKLLALGTDTPQGLELRVHPALIPAAHPLASVGDVYNAIFVEGDAVGQVMFYGRGAGADPTGSAVVGDLIDIARNLTHGATGRVPCTCFLDKPVKPMDQVQSEFYLRMQVVDRPGVLAKVATIFGEEAVSLQSVVQRASYGDRAEIVWITHRVAEGNLNRSAARIEQLPEVLEISSRLRVVAA